MTCRAKIFDVLLEISIHERLITGVYKIHLFRILNYFTCNKYLLYIADNRYEI